MFFYTTKTGKGKASHRHIVFVNGAGEWLLSTDKGHSHAVEKRIIAPVPPPMAEGTMGIPEAMPGQPMMAAMGGAGFSGMRPPMAPPQVQTVILPHEGHTHEMTTEQVSDSTAVKNTEESKTDTEKLDFAISLYKEAQTLEGDAIKEAEESESFYHGGGQWKKKDKDDLEAVDRAALTINEIEAKMDVLSGYQRQNRTDIRYFPVEDGDATVGDILNVASKVALGSEYPVIETDVFEDGSITGRGAMIPFLDYDKDMRGVFAVDQLPWRLLRCGPHEKKDLSDCDYITIEKWFSKSQIKQMFPDKAEQVSAALDASQATNTDKTVYADSQYNHGEGTPVATEGLKGGSDFVNLARKEYKVVELQRKVHKRIPVILNVDESIYINAEQWSPEDRASVKSIMGFKEVKRPRSPVRVTTFTAGVVLDDEWASDREEWIDPEDFSPIVFYAKKRGGKWWGKVQGAKDAQRELNKRHSQATDILNKVAGYGVIYEEDAFSDKKDENAFKNGFSAPGFFLKVNNYEKIHEKEGVKFPNEIVGMLELASSKISQIMNVTIPQGTPPGTSGIALVEARRGELTGNEFLFDNLSVMKRKLGRRIVMAFQKAYTPERIMRIVGNENKRSPVMVGGQPLMDKNTPPDEAKKKMQAILTLLREKDLTKYDVAIGESAFNPTTRHANFIIMSDLAGRGLPIPPSVLVDLSDMPDKEKVKAEITRFMEGQQKVEQDKNKVEIAKTLIAKSGKEGAGA